MKRPPLVAEAVLFARIELGGADEEQHEGEEREGLDESEAEDEEELDSGAGAGVAG